MDMFINISRILMKYDYSRAVLSKPLSPASDFNSLLEEDFRQKHFITCFLKWVLYVTYTKGLMNVVHWHKKTTTKTISSLISAYRFFRKMYVTIRYGSQRRKNKIVMMTYVFMSKESFFAIWYTFFCLTTCFGVPFWTLLSVFSSSEESLLT